LRFLVVATFAWPDHYGGAERVIGEVAERLVQRGHAVTLLTSRLADLPERELRAGVEVRRYAVDRGSPVRFYRSVFTGVRGALRGLADAGRGTGGLPDVVHVHQMLSGVAALTDRTLRRPVIASFYAPYHEEYLARFRDGHADGGTPLRARAVSALLRHGDRTLLRRSARLLVLSRYSLAQAEALDPGAAARATVAPPGVDLLRFAPAAGGPARARAAAGFGLPADGTPLLLSVRRLVPRMGLPDLLAAAAALRAGGRALHVAIAGEGSQRAELERLAAASGLLPHCSFLGRVDEARLPELYRAASVFVLPTRSLEGFGMATAEALASGLPVVATDAGASAELLAGSAIGGATDGATGGALVPAGDAGSLARALEALLADAAARERAGRAARAFAERSLRWEGHVGAVEAAAQQALLDARAGAGSGAAR
jgi:glycosyltransferase involved in cell wall biosynthesis